MKFKSCSSQNIFSRLAYIFSIVMFYMNCRYLVVIRWNSDIVLIHCNIYLCYKEYISPQSVISICW